MKVVVENRRVVLSAVIDNAIEAARNAYKAQVDGSGDAGAAGFGFISLNLREMNNRPLIKKLADQGYGRFDQSAFDYRVDIHTWIEGEKVQSIAAQEAACRAAMVVMHDVGFDARYVGVVD